MQPPLIALLLFGLFTQAGLAAEAMSQEAASKWLQRMGKSLHELNYVGVFVYQHGDQLSAMQIIHGHNELGERERLVNLTGSQREVIRNNDQVTCILPDTRSVVVERNGQSSVGFPYILPQQLQGIAKVYRFELGQQGRVAGRMAQQVRILPKDHYRYSYQLWLDNETGMLMKAELLNGKQVIEQFMFTHLDFLAAIPDARFQPDVEEGDFLSYQHQGRTEAEPVAVADRSWRVDNLPEGFALTNQQSQLQAGKQEPVQQLIYSDGLSTVSVFIERLQPKERPMKGPSPRGAVNAYATVVDSTQVTAVGEVPAQTVKQIAESTHHSGR